MESHSQHVAHMICTSTELVETVTPFHAPRQHCGRGLPGAVSRLACFHSISQAHPQAHRLARVNFSFLMRRRCTFSHTHTLILVAAWHNMKPDTHTPTHTCTHPHNHNTSARCDDNCIFTYSREDWCEGHTVERYHQHQHSK